MKNVSAEGVEKRKVRQKVTGHGVPEKGRS